MQHDKNSEITAQQESQPPDRLPKEPLTEIRPAMDQSTFDLARSLTNQSNATANRHNHLQDPDIERDAADEPLPSTNLEKIQTSSDEAKDPFLVKWEKDDKDNPKNWSMSRKWFLVFFLSWITLLT